jgi:tripartite-type tricarboxylate transporter receptor subunit TctC
MKLRRRTFLHLAAGAAALPAVSHMAQAQAYPSRPVRIIVGFPPAGSTDIFARLIAQWLSERLGQQFIVENRPGVGGNLGTEAVVRANPDGYTLLLTASNDARNATLYESLNFNFIRDITPVANIVRGVGILAVHPSLSVKSVPELITLAKETPGKITVASAGVGSAPHVFWELFRTLAGVDMLHVPYRGGGPALIDLLAGHVQTMFPTLGSVVEYLKDGKLRALAVTGSTRSEILLDVPIMGEFVKGYEAIDWYGVGAPKNTPPDVVDKLNREINAGLGDPKIRERIIQLGGEPAPMMPDEFRRFIVADTEKWGKVIRAANIKAE